jgi:hypothetical protein
VVSVEEGEETSGAAIVFEKRLQRGRNKMLGKKK